jgi:hypothetical protein
LVVYVPFLNASRPVKIHAHKVLLDLSGLPKLGDSLAHHVLIGFMGVKGHEAKLLCVFSEKRSESQRYYEHQPDDLSNSANLR